MGAEYSRRTVLKTGAAGLAAALAGCNGRTGTGSTGTSLESQLEEVASATEQYSEPTAALEDGFQVAGPSIPGQGWHFINEQRVQAAAEEGVSRSEPQVLTYDTEMELIAVEWAVPAEAVEEPPDLFDDGGADATEEWHTHESFTHVFANGDGEATDPGDVAFEEWTTADNWAAFRPPDPDLSPGDEVALEWGVESPDADEGDETRVADVAATHPEIETLHVWVHRENPEGVFAPAHPEVAGGAGGDHDH